ncbi:MAG TPA: serine hydrolase domain-containing protein [Thermotogota bacterium]|nr:serine hydrolase domain-containing protein [Thermotogota bacterium]HRW34526.1 serine hydrolase domain-containing protein [Thermotogota bacterium]
MTIKELAMEAIEAKLFPGVAIGVTDSSQTIISQVFGTTDEKKPTTEETLYDIASLTKVTATLPAILKLIQDGEIDLFDKVSDYIEFTDNETQLWHLLSHTSGMPPYSAAYQYKSSRDEILHEIQMELFKTGPEKQVVYSCLNYILLMVIVEKVTGGFKNFVDKAIFQPLTMEHTMYNPSNHFDIAPTSIRKSQRLTGEPDDELAYSLNGLSGNAGLFSNLQDLLKYARELLNPHKVFSKSTIQLSVKRWTRGIPGDEKGLGWMHYTPASSGGCLLSDKAFGHTGFTGTSLWVDPESDLAIVILSNRCFYSRHERITEMLRFRRRVSNRLVTSIKMGERA